MLVRLKEAVDDAQGRVVAQALKDLGFEGVEKVRIGKVVELWLSKSHDSRERHQTVDQMCRLLLANPVIEDYEIREEDSNK